jgi:hypothetical protein
VYAVVYTGMRVYGIRYTKHTDAARYYCKQ